jgi:hypothetical protein
MKQILSLRRIVLGIEPSKPSSGGSAEATG